MPTPLTLEQLSKLIESKAGECLTDEQTFRRLQTIHLRCKNGHVWQTTPTNLFSGKWCSVCERETRAAMRLAEIHQIAIAHEGKCLSDQYFRGNLRLTFQCKKGHVWKATSANIKKGTWCRKCYVVSQRLTIQDMVELAKKRNWKCLSTNYDGANSNLLWECSLGHRWEARPSNITGSNSGCPHCAGQVLTIEDMHDLARRNKGKCISSRYVNSKSKLKWECQYGHSFEMKPNQVQQGQWCVVCAHKIPITIQDMRNLARDRKGTCLSSKYSGDGKKLNWRCKQGHLFWMTPNDVKRNHWCRLCYNERVRLRHLRNRVLMKK